MRCSLLLFAGLSTVHAGHILLSNVDGWASTNIRNLYDTLVTYRHDVILSAPAKDKSGNGIKDEPPKFLGKHGCHKDSCPPYSEPTGAAPSDPRLNYVNSYAVTSVKYGLEKLAPDIWGGATPDLVITGPNKGWNYGGGDGFEHSSTVGAAMWVVKHANIPAIAFSGAKHHSVSRTNADLSLKIINQLLASGKPYLPDGVWLNVNFPHGARQCSPDEYKFILTRVSPNHSSTWGPDVEWCDNNGSLPSEKMVANLERCYVAIGVGNARYVTTSDAARQEMVLGKLAPALSCI
ncbi:5'/3'-nucleotidase sure [Sporormia fimetaria CBS 119925]|uniref:5'/3'-nucleotidase sure n=1 Tax=Sporormia fimetaria CBS 119925 TaxID=1340428 RepID=A0A6A6VG02_9PLEO|nr:5'/3'-nucleotidase sure [Sporormia fimetaria CBS 119925]